MKLTTVSNYINHHRIPLSNELYRALGEDYHFIQTEPMDEERVKMGWGKELKQIPYLKMYYDEPEACQQMIMDSDIVIYSGLEEESYIQPRLQKGLPVIRGSERLYREGQWKAISPRGLRKKYLDHTRYRNAPVYLLCHGAYVASDFHIVRAYPDKMFKWGYFTEVKEYDLEQLFAQKVNSRMRGRECISILWAGRFMPLKHPEYAIETAKILKQLNKNFHLDMIGGGEMEQACKNLVKQYGLEKEVTFHEFMQPTAVREFMERADIFIFSSNHLEGWGAVLNESMNSACAVVAGSGIGAVPFLIEDGHNGLIYPNEKMHACIRQVVRLVEDEELRKKLGRNAYQTMVTLWNPQVASKRLLNFCENILSGKVEGEETGPLSKAEILSPRKGYAYETK